MKLTVLVDNNTFIDKYFVGEPAVSYFIECEGKKILFDAGYSNILITNAQRLGINLASIDYLTFSHGHSDHIGGLPHLLQLFTEDRSMSTGQSKPILLTHPDTLLRAAFEQTETAAIVLREDDLAKYFQIRTTRKPYWITDRLVFLGEIPRANDFEAEVPFGKIVKNNIEEDDFIIEDSALAYKSDDGLSVITGCSHSGICNIVEYARDVCGDRRVVDIIGGFHLLSPSNETLRRTGEYMGRLKPRKVHVCHCTDLKSKLALAKVVDVEEVGVGLVLEH